MNFVFGCHTRIVNDKDDRWQRAQARGEAPMYTAVRSRRHQHAGGWQLPVSYRRCRRLWYKCLLHTDDGGSAQVHDRIEQFFKMKIQGKRYNHYRDMTNWKPFHHDAAGLDKDAGKGKGKRKGKGGGRPPMCELDQTIHYCGALCAGSWHTSAVCVSLSIDRRDAKHDGRRVVRCGQPAELPLPCRLGPCSCRLFPSSGSFLPPPDALRHRARRVSTASAGFPAVETAPALRVGSGAATHACAVMGGGDTDI